MTLHFLLGDQKIKDHLDFPTSLSEGGTIRLFWSFERLYSLLWYPHQLTHRERPSRCHQRDRPFFHRTSCQKRPRYKQNRLELTIAERPPESPVQTRVMVQPPSVAPHNLRASLAQTPPTIYASYPTSYKFWFKKRSIESTEEIAFELI